jgi:hypothetical protein
VMSETLADAGIFTRGKRKYRLICRADSCQRTNGCIFGNCSWLGLISVENSHVKFHPQNPSPSKATTVISRDVPDPDTGIR